MGYGILAALRPTWLRAALLAPIVGLLFVGSLDLHSNSREHSALEVAHVVYSDARHPDAPAHLETSRAEVVPACPACLVQLKNLAGALPEVAIQTQPPTILASRVLLDQVPASRSLLSPLSRGPPQA